MTFLCAMQKTNDMKIDNIYTEKEIESLGFSSKDVKDLNTRIYTLGDKVYFFEQMDSDKLRLYTIISKKSFFI